MSYLVKLRRAAQKELDRVSKRDYEAVGLIISELEHEPRPQGVKKLAESGLWRIRVGQYRIVYSIDDKERLVIIVRVARRAENTYQKL